MTTKNETGNRNGFIAHDVALRAAAQVFDLLRSVPPDCRDLADQARRAAASVSLNLAEGAGRAGKDRVYHFRVAYGSVKEAESALTLLVAVAPVDVGKAQASLRILDRLGGLIWGLIRRPGSGMAGGT